MNSESLCEFDASVGFKICKCLSGYEEVNGAQNRLYCSSVTYPPESVPPPQSTEKPAREVELIATPTNTSPETHEGVELFKESPQEERDARMQKDSTDLKNLIIKFGKSSQIGLIVFGGVILMAILLVVIVIR